MTFRGESVDGRTDDDGGTVHVVFGTSVAATLREALALVGRRGRVIGLPDALDVGPIDPPDPTLRQAWSRSVLRANPMLRDGLVDDPAEVEKAWAAASAPGVAPAFWACLDSPSEHACFLAFTALMRDRPFDVVDATGLVVPTAGGTEPLRSLGRMRVQAFVASNLLARRRAITAGERRVAVEAWSRLQRENASLRIVRDGRLVSAPLTHYDPMLIAQAGQDFEVAARVIGRVMAAFEHGPRGEATSDVVLFGRMLALGDDGALEIEGPGPGMRDYRVRRAGVSH